MARRSQKPASGDVFRMIRALAAALAMCTMNACIIPQPLEIEPDQGVNRPPTVIPIKPKSGLPFTVNQQGKGQPPVETTFEVVVNDPDRQTLSLRLFLGDTPLDPTVQAVAPGGADGVFKQLKVEGLCDELVNFETGSYAVALAVSDKGFLDDSPSLPQPGGYAPQVQWTMKCEPPLAP